MGGLAGRLAEREEPMHGGAGSVAEAEKVGGWAAAWSRFDVERYLCGYRKAVKLLR